MQVGCAGLWVGWRAVWLGEARLGLGLGVWSSVGLECGGLDWGR